MNFIDWLSISQAAEPGSLPVVGSEFRISTSLETGELVRQQVIGFQHEGSYDTSLHIRSDGSTVAVSGNPSAYGRPDNLYGLDSVDLAVCSINRELFGLGLPALDSVRPHEEMRSGCTVALRKTEAVKAMRDGIIIIGEYDTDQGRQYARTDSLIRDDRARISRIDITENIATSGAVDFIRHLSSYVHHGSAGNLYPNGRTVDWGKGSRRIYQKYYDKAFDIEQKIKKLQKSLNSKEFERIKAHIEYLETLKKWCQENGIVRRETTFKSTELIDRKLTYIETWNGDAMNTVIRPYQFHKKLHIEETRFTGIYETLVSKGIKESYAKKAELIHTSWINGGDVRNLAGGKRSFYVYRNILLNIGVDIANPCDISRITLRAHKSEWREIEPPSWYCMPGHDVANQLRAA